MASPVTTTTEPERHHETGVLGWPKWFITLFGTDVWERFSFYGMAAILVLYISAPPGEGGLGLSNDDATMIYGLYMAAIFLSSLPGGWIGDRLLGAYRAVLYGGVMIAIGHALLSIPTTGSFYLGLISIALGTGLLKPNMANLLAAFYRPDDRKGRDAGFAIFYMSVQVSALLSPVAVGTLGEGVNWHLGFGAAALGMVLGLTQYVRGSRHFGETGGAPSRAASPDERRRVFRRTLISVAVVAVLFGADAVAGTFEIGHAMGLIGLLCVATPAICFWRIIRSPEITAEERVRVKTYIWLFLVSAVFWALFLQAGSVFSLFARDAVDRDLFGLTVPASWFQSLLPLFVLVTAPFFAWLWRAHGDRLSTASNFAIGMSFLAVGYLTMALAAASASDGALVTPLWLVGAFLMLAAGEVAFAPVGMSATTAIAPRTYVSQMVGLFWLAGALGGGMGANALKVSDDELPGAGYFFGIAVAAVVIAVCLLLSRKALRSRLGV